MTKVTVPEIEALARHLSLTLSNEDKEMLAACFSGYKDQLARLHELDLEGEDVAGAFAMPRREAP